MSEPDVEYIDDDLEGSEYEYTQELTWLHKMEGYLAWKVIGPRISNPFEQALPDRLLMQLEQKRDKVLQLIKVRCMCDGHEVLVIDNLGSPVLTTDHPCLTGLTRHDVMDYMQSIGLQVEIDRTIDTIQQEIREELARREIKAAAENRGNGQKSIGEIRKEREKKEKDARAAKNGGRKDGGHRVMVVRR